MIGTFFGHSIATSDEPADFIHNLSTTEIPMIRIETDVGESYDFGSLASDASRRLKIPGRDKLAWIAIITASGQKKESPIIYDSVEGVIVVVITESGVTVDYVL